MKISSMFSKPGRRDVFAVLHRQLGHRAYRTWFADDNQYTGVGSTRAKAIADLRAQRKMVARWGRRD